MALRTPSTAHGFAAADTPSAPTCSGTTPATASCPCSRTCSTTRLIRSLELTSEGFGFEPEVTAKILRRGDVRLYELPISYYGRTYAEGKKVSWRDGARAVYQLIRFRFGRDGAPPPQG